MSAHAFDHEDTADHLEGVFGFVISFVRLICVFGFVVSFVGLICVFSFPAFLLSCKERIEL